MVSGRVRGPDASRRATVTQHQFLGRRCGCAVDRSLLLARRPRWAVCAPGDGLMVTAALLLVNGLGVVVPVSAHGPATRRGDGWPSLKARPSALMRTLLNFVSSGFAASRVSFGLFAGHVTFGPSLVLLRDAFPLEFGIPGEPSGHLLRLSFQSFDCALGPFFWSCAHSFFSLRLYWPVAGCATKPGWRHRIVRGRRWLYPSGHEQEHRCHVLRGGRPDIHGSGPPSAVTGLRAGTSATDPRSLGGQPLGFEGLPARLWSVLSSALAG